MTKESKYLYIAILIPTLMIVITAISVFYYKKELHPQHNFVYMMKNDSDAYQCWSQLKSEIFPKTNTQQTTHSTPPKDCSSVKFYEYDFANNKSTLVTLAQVKQMKLSDPDNATSADGFKVNNYCYSSDVFGWGFSSRSYYSACIKNGDYQQKLNIDFSNDNSNEYSYLFFVGWILDSTPRYNP